MTVLLLLMLVPLAALFGLIWGIVMILRGIVKFFENIGTPRG